MDEIKNKNNRLSIYLLKDDFDVNNLLTDTGEASFTFENGTIYYLNQDKGNPEWVSGFFENNNELKSKLKNRNSRAVLLTKIEYEGKEHHFAVCFGYGKAMINSEAIEDRFGLFVTLNSIDSEKIRYIQKKEISFNQLASRQQVPNPSDIDEFDINIARDLVGMIAGKSLDCDISKGVIVGADVFCATAEVTLTNINDYLLKLYKKYIAQTYKGKFAWIDNIIPINNKALINRLDELLVSSINNKDDNFFAAPPDVVDWEHVDHFTIPFVEGPVDDISLEDIVSNSPTIKLGTLKGQKIYCFSKENEVPTDSWSLYKCLYGQLTFDNKEYCIDSGHWYEINKDYAKTVNENYESIPLSSIPFHNATINTDEGKYNSDMADESDDYLCMDKQNISAKGYNSKIEVCDVLYKNKILICNKMYTGSATLSHLFNQGKVAVQLLRRDIDFVDKANKKISEILDEEKRTSDYDNFKLDKNSIEEVVFGIIGKFSSDRPKIPFFSKVILCDVVDNLNNPYQVKVSIKSGFKPKKPVKKKARKRKDELV
jgi:uncharacterized protein (TIGR04141 family)